MTSKCHSRFLYLFDFFQNTISEWNNVFLVGSVVYVVPAIVFMVFGSGEVQPWNDTTTPAALAAKEKQLGSNNGPSNLESKPAQRPVTSISAMVAEKTVDITRL